MGFRRQDLQEAFFVPGTHGFRVWGYGTTDRLDEVLRPNYLRGGEALVHAGDLIYVRTRSGRDPVDGREVGATRVALVMVSGFERGDEGGALGGREPAAALAHHEAVGDLEGAATRRPGARP